MVIERETPTRAVETLYILFFWFFLIIVSYSDMDEATSHYHKTARQRPGLENLSAQWQDHSCPCLWRMSRCSCSGLRVRSIKLVSFDGPFPLPKELGWQKTPRVDVKLNSFSSGAGAFCILDLPVSDHTELPSQAPTLPGECFCCRVAAWGGYGR